MHTNALFRLIGNNCSRHLGDTILMLRLDAVDGSVAALQGLRQLLNGFAVDNATRFVGSPAKNSVNP